ncbi:hypothetical protein FAES_2483 [Fibrella aestuarina BUZ 2]|uniref:Uncharacterized protein n=1 Tax=Fibrella aestuarina BUZ 2 TaxID=1166018 RepID=I0K8N9_9BACT|nr:hypothetical protein FAES_2483 [Fibrella aestuarina BUZ 2]
MYGFAPIVAHELNYLVVAWFDKLSLAAFPLGKQTAPDPDRANRYWLNFS